MNALRPYQQELYIKAREALKQYRSVCIQSATGSGKTPLVSAMVDSVNTKNKRAWFIVPRRELLTQASNHFRKWNVPHGRISPNFNESRAYKIHIVSKDTLIRRYDKIKNWPDLMIFDESHLYLDRQHEIISHLPEHTKILGMTATPERLDGRGLSEVYNDLIEGPSIPWLMKNGYLSQLRYFSPPIEGLYDLKVRGTDYDEEQLEELLKRRKIYGELIGHYEKYGKGKPGLIFCRSVKSAYQTAERFREKGFNAHCIEGKMTDKKRKDLISALTAGNIDLLTNCDLCTYGLDVPRVEYGASIRPTLSRSLYMQIIGRLLRPWEDQKTGYKKEEALFFDHVNLILEHQDDNYPGIPLHYVPEITWNFEGTEKRKRKKKETNIKLCQYLDFMYCENPHCQTCDKNPDKSVKDARRQMVVVQTELEEKPKPQGLKDLPFPERREIEDKINNAVLEYRNSEESGPIKELLDIADKHGYHYLWAYWKLVDKNRKSINITLLHEICRIKNWKPGKVWYIMKELKKKGYIDYEEKQEVINE